VILAAFYSRRANAWGAVSAIAAGTLVTFFWDTLKTHLPPVLAQRDAIFPALVVAVLSLVVVSALTPPPRPEQVELFFPVES
jgi:SSS family solute:Na+ symporter/sodium/proline symporter